MIKKFKLFELNNFKNLKDDINGILVELKDMGYNIRTYGLYDDGSLSGGDTFSFIISKGGEEGFLVNGVKDYLDTCIDYMDLYYKYKTEVNYKPVYSNRELNLTYKELEDILYHANLIGGNLHFNVKTIVLIFTDISKK